MSEDSKIIVALDFPDANSALSLVEQLQPSMCKLKIGKELFTRAGPSLVEQLVAKGFDIFLDLKFHDIPNTVANACRVATELGVWMLNVHASGGRAMMEAARESVNKCSQSPFLIAVTVLTSMDDDALHEVGVNSNANEQVIRLATLARSAGMDGVVCSAQETSELRDKIGPDFVLVTPGIRPANSEKGDQKRVMTPAQAIANGSDYLVIGRPVTQAKSPIDVISTISSELAVR